MSIEKELEKGKQKLERVLMFIPIIRDIYALISGTILGIKTVIKDYDVDRARFLKDNGMMENITNDKS